jgi:hypothetical protein
MHTQYQSEFDEAPAFCFLLSAFSVLYCCMIGPSMILGSFISNILSSVAFSPHIKLKTEASLSPSPSLSLPPSPSPSIFEF